MATFTQSQGAKSSSVLTITSLANGTYLASSSIDLGANIPLDVSVEVEATPSSATTTPKRLLVFVKFSLDNTNFSSGPESGTTTTNEIDLIHIGTLACNDNTLHRRIFSLQGLPIARYVKIVVKNETGVSISGNVYTSAITGTST